MEKQLKLKIEHILLSQVKLAPYNPRTMSDVVRQQLSRSLSHFGYKDPIIWNKRTTHVVGGNQRVIDLREKGIESLDVVVVDLSLTEEKALNVALNKITGDWDFEKLGAVLRDLKGEEFDLTLTGYEEAEAAILLQDEESFKFNEEEDNIPEESTSPLPTRSFVIYLTFSEKERAEAYLLEHYKQNFKEGSFTATVDMDEFQGCSQ